VPQLKGLSNPKAIGPSIIPTITETTIKLQKIISEHLFLYYQKRKDLLKITGV
jgi:hypothetical protein